MKSVVGKSGLIALGLALVVMTGCASNARVDEAAAQAQAAQQAADAAMSAAQRAQQTADAALRSANEANEAVSRMSENCCRK